MFIKEVELTDFSAFAEARLQFSPGINVFIGANATGKTHLLKLLYSVCSAAPKRSEPAIKARFEDKLKTKLINVFKPDDEGLERLIRGNETNARVEMNCDRAVIGFEIDKSGKLDVGALKFKDGIRSLFIPSKEVLSIFPGFITAYSEKELSFDETYYDLCVALSGAHLKSKLKERVEIVKVLQGMLEGKVVFSGTDFHIKAPGDEHGTEAQLISEGMRKIAMLSHLMDTGAIRRDGILFWDEPESSLNPKYITKVAKVIRRLSAMNVQVFLATHDYLLTRELSLAAEYGEEPKVPTRFFCFQRESLSAPTTIETGERLADLKHNPILDEFIANYEHEERLFSKDIK